MHALLLTLQQATSDPCLCWRLLDTHRQVWISLLWGHCSSSPGSWCVQGFVCALQESVSQSCGSSGGSMVGLMATSSSLLHLKPLRQSTADPLPPQFSSVAQSCPTLCDPVNCSTPGLPVHQLLEFTQTHVH